MDKLFISSSDINPEINFDHQTLSFKIEGESRPENARKFYLPVIDWLQHYNQLLYYYNGESGKKYDKQIHFNFSFVYMNSSSIKMLFEIIRKIEELMPNAANVAINWYFEDGDDDMRENGEELKTMFTVPIHIIKK